MASNPLRKPFNYCFINTSVIIILINFGVFALTSFFPKIQIYLGLCPALFIKYKMFWQPFTYMFIHGNFTHIFSNMLGLFFFGTSVEKAIGSKEFLLLYLLSGVLTGLFSLAYNLFAGSVNTILIGASGALYAVLFAFAVIFPKANIYIWGILPIPSPVLVLIYAAIELFSQITGMRSNIAHFAHLFGFLASFLYFVIRMGINPFKVWKENYRR